MSVNTFASKKIDIVAAQSAATISIFLSPVLILTKQTTNQHDMRQYAHSFVVVEQLKYRYSSGAGSSGFKLEVKIMRQLIDILDLVWRRKITRFSGAVFGLLFLSMVYGNDFVAIAKPKHSQYGLGIEVKERGSLHAPPSYCVVAIAPRDGGRTISEYPTFYVYLLKKEDAFVTSNITGLIFKLYGKLDIPSRNLAIFRGRVRNLDLEEGLYKINLSTVNSSVLNGEVQSWKTYLIGSDDMFSEYANTYIQRVPDHSLFREIRSVTTKLKQAQIYAKYYYWYDAFDAYTQWLETNPTDANARRERAKMLQEIYHSPHNRCISSEKLLKLIDESKSAKPIAFPRWSEREKI